MATTYQNPSRSVARSNVQKPRTKKPTPQQPPSRIINNSKGMKTRVGHTSSQNSMYPSTSILKRKPSPPLSINQLDDNLSDWRQPSDLEPVRRRPFYSPIHTPPRLRTLLTPPGIEPYRNLHNLRRFHSPLPGVDNWYHPPIGLETWGLDPTDSRFNTNLNLMRRYPSPLSRFGLGSSIERQKKPYIVIPHLTNYLSPPVSSSGAYYTLPSRRLSPIYVPDAQYTYLDRIDSFSLARFHREPSDYVYLRKNDAFANGYIEEFIGKSIEDQLIPDILLEIIADLEREGQNRGGKSNKKQFDRYNAKLNQRIHRAETADKHSFTDEWTRELDHQRSPAASLKPVDSHELPPIQTNSRVRYRDLPPDVQARLLADINQELIDFETQNMIADLSGQTLTERVHSVPIRNDSRRDIQPETVREVMHDTHNLQRIEQVQTNPVEQYTQDKLLDTICLNQLLRKHIRQTGSAVDMDDFSRLLDATVLENLTSQYQIIDENRSRTVDNYGSKKIHLNTFMNTTMDFLLSELSDSLVEDMKDVDEQERRTFSFVA